MREHCGDTGQVLGDEVDERDIRLIQTQRVQGDNMSTLRSPVRLCHSVCRIASSYHRDRL